MLDINFGALPLFSGLDRVDLAKLIPSFAREEHVQGTVLFRQGDTGDALYIVIRGSVRILLHHSHGEREVARLGSGECFGEMALLTGEPRTADAISMTDTTLLRLTKKHFDEILAKHSSLAVHFASLLASRAAAIYSRKNAADEQARPSDEIQAITAEVVSMGGVSGLSGMLKHPKLIALAITAIVCTCTTLMLQSKGVKQEHIILLELLLAAMVVWSLDIISYHAVSFGLPLAAVLLHIDKPEKAFSGFAKPSWFMALGVFALMAAISKTGLLYRFSLRILSRFPPNYLGQAFALALAGWLLTPIIPSANGRAILASPIALTLSETLQLEKGGKGSVGIAMFCLLGFGHMSFMFMNGTAACFFVMGLLPAEIAATLTWGAWLQAALPLGISFFAISFVVILILFRPRETSILSHDIIAAQLRTLGPMTFAEKLTLSTVAVSLIGFATQRWHGVDEAWVAMFCFFILFASTVLDDQSLREMDWSFLISYGAMTGFASLTQTTGLADVIVETIKPSLHLVSWHPVPLLLTTSIAVHLLRFFLPQTPALLVTMLAITPLVASAGVNPFIVGLVALISSNPWILQHQNSIYRNIWKATGGKLFKHEKTTSYAILHVAIVLVAVLVSIPVWYHLGLLR